MKSKKEPYDYKRYFIPIILVISLVAFLSIYIDNEIGGVIIKNKNPETASNYFDNSEIKINSDGTKYIVNPDDISKGAGKGGIGIDKGIPSIAKPKFVSVSEADNWIQDKELVLAFEYKGVKRVYPLQILVWHEIVNEQIKGEAILITYCPLCGSGIAYERYIDFNGKRTESMFGTSGKLYNSNLIMYDQETNTYWQQIDGKAIVGELTGQELKELSIDTVVWGDYKPIHPDAEVLSQETGFTRAYGVDPYGSYYEDSYIIFDVENRDDRIHPKTPIVGIEVDGIFKAYREEDLKENPIIEDIVNGVNIKVERDKAGIIKITNTETGKEIIKERDFWFAWYAFHPETELYKD
jgi:hypothetical protein